MNPYRERTWQADIVIIEGREPSPGYGWSETSQPEHVYRGFKLLLNTEQFPHRDNRVVLGRALDLLGAP